MSGEPFVLTDAATPALSRVDIGVSNGKIAFITPAGRAPDNGWRREALDGGMAWPAFVDAHTHLDSAQICERSPNPDGSFTGAQGAMFADRDNHWTPDDMARRLDFGLRCAFAHGTRAIRTHLASQNDQVATRWDIFSAAREAWAGRIDLQAVTLIATDALKDPAVFERTVAAVRRPGGVLGAFAPPSPDLPAMLHRLFAAAEAHGLDLDFHADETGDPSSAVLAMIAEVAIERGFQGRVLVGHACSLAMQDEATADRTLDRVAQAGIAIVSLPGANLYLQDRTPGRTPRWRGVTLLKEMAARGIPVALGSDNCRDAFHPYGDYDMLDTFRDAVRIGHLDHPIGGWPGAVTTGAATILGLADRAFEAGAPADLILFKARSYSELLSRPQADRRIIRGGAPVDAPLPDYRELDEALS